MADSTQQRLWTQEVENLLASVQQAEVDLEHYVWGLQHRLELLRNLAAHALTGGQPLVASAIYQQIGEMENRMDHIRKNLPIPSRC